jgi:PAS domain S-box-containing protein
MQDVKALIEQFKDELDKMGDTPTTDNICASMTRIFGCDISCFLSDNDVFQTMLDAIPVPVYYKSKDGVYLACNKALSQIYGFEKKDILGKTAYAFFTKDTADMFTQGDIALLHEGSEDRVQHRGRFPGMDDSFHIIHKSAFKRNGKVEGIIGVILDMTDVKMVEDSAWASEAFFKSLFENAPMPMVIINSFNMILDMNSAAVRTLNPEHAVPGQEISSLFRYHSDFEKVMSGEEAVRVEVYGSSGVIEMIAMVSSNVLNGETSYAITFMRTDM